MTMSDAEERARGRLDEVLAEWEGLSDQAASRAAGASLEDIKARFLELRAEIYEIFAIIEQANRLH